ncbi:pirin family protein [Halobellus rufus]|uniref:pirin family protein n=1 Tax=Halobellus rufus TaxID=1448860 RepID=UPI0006795743|nr:pirin family protein [Halobellus rufus]
MDEPESVNGGVVAGQRVRHGTGVHSTRAFPTSDYASHLDPFVLFEQFYIDPDRGFPMHAHRGFEILSYMIDGGMAHEDSLGVSNTAYAGEAMRITAGCGVRHSEFPADGAACTGLQLWVNLPREDKEVEPSYADADADDLPTEDADGATVTTVVGDGSPLSLRTPMEYLDVVVDGGGRGSAVDEGWTWSRPEDWAGFLYGVSGSGTVDCAGGRSADGAAFGEGDALPVAADAVADVELRSDEGLRVVAVAGEPHDEPIRQRGPFVL